MMQVNIKQFDVAMEVKTKGVELEIRDSSGQRGDLLITKSKLVWCPGKTTPEHGKKLSWEKFIAMMEEL